MLGFGALGEFALGEGPMPQSSFVGGSFSQPLKKAVSVAVIATTAVGFVPPQTPAKAATFTKFSQPPLKKTSPALFQNWLRAPASLTPQSVVFTDFGRPTQPKPNVPVAERGFFLEQETPVSPVQFTGFMDFSPFCRSRVSPLALYVGFTGFVPNPPGPDTHDLVFPSDWRKKRKQRRDPLEEETEIKRKRREAIELALYGPIVEYQLPPLVLPEITNYPNVSELAQTIVAARLQQEEAQKAAELLQDEQDIEDILKDIL